MLILAKAVLALMIGFIISVIFGLVAIPFLRKLKVKQQVSVFLAKTHKDKEGTPTMGGLIFIIPTIVTIIILLLMGKIEFSENLFIVMFVFIGYAILGFIDDFLIIRRHNNEGLTEIQKLFGQLFIALVFFYIFMKSGNEPVLDIHTLGFRIDMGWFYGIFLLFILVASSNAVNLTDGLDGLATVVSIIVLLFLFVVGFMIGKIDLSIFAFILVGALMAFLIFNVNPAKVFMGDTGSLALGGAIAAIAFIFKIEVIMIFVGIIYVIETLSVIIQVLVYKLTKKRVFKMAPIHHHFEHLGWSENKIVYVFGTITLIACILSFLML